MLSRSAPILLIVLLVLLASFIGCLDLQLHTRAAGGPAPATALSREDPLDDVDRIASEARAPTLALTLGRPGRMACLRETAGVALSGLGRRAEPPVHRPPL